MDLIKTWRWFGENDEVELSWLKENGIAEVVTALHHIKNGEVWPLHEIKKVQQTIEEAGLKWTVVESLPVTSEIKTASLKRDLHIKNYKESIRNLAKCGIKTVVYNFMPVLDWVRTNLAYSLSRGKESMCFDYPSFVAFDVFILKRHNAQHDYPKSLLWTAKRKFKTMTALEREQLARNIIVVTQGFIDGEANFGEKDYKAAFLKQLEAYRSIDDKALRKNLDYFLNELIPVAEEVGVNLAIHPDDPPFPVLGLPRIFCTVNDIQWLEKVNSSERNGIAFCAGSFSARKDNDVVEMARRFAHRIYFAHLRNTQVLDDGSFYESGHIEGRVNMHELLAVLQREMLRRKEMGRTDYKIPMRPDHGIKGERDKKLKANPGYPKYGRLAGLREIEQIEKERQLNA